MNLNKLNIDFGKYKNLFIKKNETILLNLTILLGVLLLFFFTHIAFKMKIDNIYKEIANAKKTLIKANELYQIYRTQSNVKTLQVSGGLLSFIQSFSRSLKLENNITSLRPNPTSSGNEGVTVRIEELTLYDIVEILTKLDKYSNLRIEIFNLTKRFDNPKKVDIYLEITKI